MQTKAGSIKATATIKRKYGEDFFKTIGKSGGANGHTGGYYHMKYVKGDVEYVRACGRMGGFISRRKPATQKEDGMTDAEIKEALGVLSLISEEPEVPKPKWKRFLWR